MSAEPALVLDVSRLISRLGGGPATGIDRVEAAWLRHLQARGRDHLLLCRVRRGQLLLPPQAGAAILRWLEGQTDHLPPPGLLDRLAGRRGLPARAAVALRRMALLRTGRDGRGLLHPIRKRLGQDVVYLNVGHANIDAGLWQSLQGVRRAALIHDTIPLDHPQFTRAGQSQKFRTRFEVLMQHADCLLTVSEATRQDVMRWRQHLGFPARAPISPAHIGTDLCAADPALLPAGLDLARPYFVTLGTIEPRKNHALLLDAWQALARLMPAQDLPRLFVIGRRGWENHEVFQRLDALPADGPVQEFNTLEDGTVAAILSRSHGLMLPSRAEGFGLPLTEAAARGVPVFCAPLPAVQELLGDYARYLSPDDHLSWAEAAALSALSLPLRVEPLKVPQWESHFGLVFKAFCDKTPSVASQSGK